VPKVSPLQNNFSGGEFSGTLFGRVDADRYKTALATCINWIPTIQGGLLRRPGTSFVAEVKDSSKATRLLEFEFSTTQAYVIEMGDQYFRFHRNHGQILEISKAITAATQANPAVITSNGHGYFNGDEVFISSVVGMVELNARNFKIANVTANTFELQDMQGVDLDSTGFGAYVSNGTVAKVFEIASIYLESQIFDVKFTQSADIIYLTHPLHPSQKLTRTDHTEWTLTEIDFLDGPYLNINNTDTTLAISGISGSVTVDASDEAGINNGEGFKATDVGRTIRWKDTTPEWTWLEITAFTDSKTVTADVRGQEPNVTTATKNWRLGVWSSTTGYPAAVTFNENRLALAGATNFPQRFDMSNSGDYENFKPTEPDDTVADDLAISFTLNASKVNVIRWLSSDEKGMAIGTVGGEWMARSSSQSEALSPTNVSVKKSTNYGSSNVQPAEAGRGVIFITKSGLKARELTYFFDVDGFRATDITVLSENILDSGVKEISYQTEPQGIIWCVRRDGVLAAVTYERDADSLKVGWHRHIFGGVSDAAGSDARAESVAVIPIPDGTSEEAWVIVQREIGGVTKKYVEFMTAFFKDTIEQKDAFHVDSGLTFDNPKIINGATQANPVVITSNAHGFANGAEVLISKVKGMTKINGPTFKVANVTANTFTLKDEDDNDIDGTAFNPYISGGEVRKYVTTISGLWHLEGEKISVNADGAARPKRVVTNGTVTLDRKATTIHLGFGYNSDGKMLRVEAGAADGTALGKTRRIHRLGIMFHRSLGLSIGTSFDKLTPVTFRNASDLGSRATPLFTGIKTEEFDADYDFENQVCFRQSDPLPCMILVIAPQMKIEDRG